MADVEFDGFDDDFGASNSKAGRSARMIGFAGALTSVALVIGLGYWGYRLAVRDMTGIPVVRAMEGPMRTAPDDPGGVIASHQGLSVNSVAGDGGTSALADRLVLAPPPVGLKADDATGTAVAMVAPVSGRSAASIGLALAPMPNVVENPVQNVSLNADTDMEALASSLSEGATPLSGDLDITLRSEPAAVFSLPKGAMAQSPRPRARPSTIALASAPAGDAASAPESAEITGDALPSGTRLVQLGAFDGEDVARKEWARLEGKFGDLLAGKTRIVQAAQSSGRTFYRLRALGFEDEADSRRFCSSLVAERAACIPVAVR
jgi:hypothetical protein